MVQICDVMGLPAPSTGKVHKLLDSKKLAQAPKLWGSKGVGANRERQDIAKWVVDLHEFLASNNVTEEGDYLYYVGRVAEGQAQHVITTLQRDGKWPDKFADAVTKLLQHFTPPTSFDATLQELVEFQMLSKETMSDFMVRGRDKAQQVKMLHAQAAALAEQEGRPLPELYECIVLAMLERALPPFFRNAYRMSHAKRFNFDEMQTVLEGIERTADLRESEKRAHTAAITPYPQPSSAPAPTPAPATAADLQRVLQILKAGPQRAGAWEQVKMAYYGRPDPKAGTPGGRGNGGRGRGDGGRGRGRGRSGRGNGAGRGGAGGEGSSGGAPAGAATQNVIAPFTCVGSAGERAEALAQKLPAHWTEDDVKGVFGCEDARAVTRCSLVLHTHTAVEDAFIDTGSGAAWIREDVLSSMDLSDGAATIYYAPVLGQRTLVADAQGHVMSRVKHVMLRTTFAGTTGSGEPAEVTYLIHYTVGGIGPAVLIGGAALARNHLVPVPHQRQLIAVNAPLLSGGVGDIIIPADVSISDITSLQRGIPSWGMGDILQLPYDAELLSNKPTTLRLQGTYMPRERRRVVLHEIAEELARYGVQLAPQQPREVEQDEAGYVTVDVLPAGGGQGRRPLPANTTLFELRDASTFHHTASTIDTERLRLGDIFSSLSVAPMLSIGPVIIAPAAVSGTGTRDAPLIRGSDARAATARRACKKPPAAPARAARCLQSAVMRARRAAAEARRQRGRPPAAPAFATHCLHSAAMRTRRAAAGTYARQRAAAASRRSAARPAAPVREACCQQLRHKQETDAFAGRVIRCLLGTTDDRDTGTASCIAPEELSRFSLNSAGVLIYTEPAQPEAASSRERATIDLPADKKSMGKGKGRACNLNDPLPTSIPLPKELTRMFLQQEDGKEDHVHDSAETRSCLRPSKYQRVIDGYGTEATASASESVSSGGGTSGGGGGAHAMPCGKYMLILQQRQTAAMEQMAAATAAAQATSAASQATLAAVLAHVQGHYLHYVLIADECHFPAPTTSPTTTPLRNT
ncbi:hypothetical protein JKP88DRAFT_240844 [Tribonema minus]|uniref:Uncharacterized protein n=1 Tax=Tribonema minus TaxID=303371 RepID=A0A835Z5U2_9STRA|nr:hypothetical protein JKP88DRAFT_240844 [Tribonema minus]